MPILAVIRGFAPSGAVYVGHAVADNEAAARSSAWEHLTSASSSRELGTLYAWKVADGDYKVTRCAAGTDVDDHSKTPPAETLIHGSAVGFYPIEYRHLGGECMLGCDLPAMRRSAVRIGDRLHFAPDRS